MTYDSTQDDFLRFPSVRPSVRPSPPLDLKSCLSDLKSDLSDLKSGLSDLKSGLSDLKSDLSDLKSCLSEFGIRKPEKIVLCGIIGHLPLRGRCPSTIYYITTYTNRGASGTADHVTLLRLSLAFPFLFPSFWAAAPEGQMTYDSTQDDFLRFPSVRPPL